jgi:hypothetical protein
MLIPRIRLFFFLALALAGCATASPQLEQGDVAHLLAENKGIVLIHTTLNDEAPAQVSVTLARRDDSGSYAVWRAAVPIKFPLDSGKSPGQLTLPAGEYGIVELHALNSREARHFMAGDAKLGGLPMRKMYDRPIAIFKVGPGEVVDAGSLRVIERRGQATLFEPTGSFSVTVTPTPDLLLQNLAERNPHLFKARVVRLMVAPAQTTQ